MSAAELQPVAMSPARSLSSNFAWTLVGNIVFSASQWAVIVALAQLGDAAAVGQFALAVAIVSPVMLLAGCALRTVQATDTRTHFALGDYLGLRMVALVAALAVVAMIAWFGNFAPLMCAVVVTVGVVKAIESLSDLLHGALQQREQMDTIGKSLLLRGVLASLLAVAAVYGARQSWPDAMSLAAAIAVGVASVAALLFCDMRWARQGGSTKLIPRFDPATLAGLAWLTLPLGFTVLLSSLTANLPRYVIEHVHSEAELGIFAALAYLALLGNLVATALANAALPRLSKHWAIGNVAAFRSLLVKLLAIGDFVRCHRRSSCTVCRSRRRFICVWTAVCESQRCVRRIGDLDGLGIPGLFLRPRPVCRATVSSAGAVECRGAGDDCSHFIRLDSSLRTARRGMGCVYHDGRAIARAMPRRGSTRRGSRPRSFRNGIEELIPDGHCNLTHPSHVARAVMAVECA